MKMLRKINDSESLEISRENVYDGGFLVKLYARLQLFYKETSGQIFPQYVSKSSCLKNNIFGKKSIMENVLIKLKPCSTKPVILSKTELNRAHVRPFCRSAENSNVFTKKPPRRRLLFSKVAGLEFIPAI